MNANEKRLELIAAAEAAVAQFPQYAGKFAGLSIGRAKRTVRTKMGVACRKGEYVLYNPAMEKLPCSTGWGLFVTIWSNSNKVHTSVRVRDIGHVLLGEEVES